MEPKLRQLTILSTRTCLCFCYASFPSAEAALLWVSSKNRDLWTGPTPDVRDSRTYRQIWKIWLAENTKRKLCTSSENRVRPEGRDSSCWPKEARPLGTPENAYACVKVKARLERLPKGRRNLEQRTVIQFTRLKQPITWKRCRSFLFLERMTPIAKRLSIDLPKNKNFEIKIFLFINRFSDLNPLILSHIWNTSTWKLLLMFDVSWVQKWNCSYLSVHFLSSDPYTFLFRCNM